MDLSEVFLQQKNLKKNGKKNIFKNMNYLNYKLTIITNISHSPLTNWIQYMLTAQK